MKLNRDNEKEGIVIAVTNQKGGTGKTTVTLNLGTALAMSGNSVLLVDVDNQISLTSGMFIDPEVTKKKNFGTALERFLDKKTVNMKNYIYHKKYVDIIAGNRMIYTLKSEIERHEEKNTIYKQLIDQLKPLYDYILIDCPPEPGTDKVRIYTAADKLLVVSEPSKYSLDGVIDAVEMAHITKQFSNDKLEVVGIVINKFNSRYKNHKEYMNLIYEEYERYMHIFETTIPLTAAVDNSVSYSKSVLQHRSKDKASIAFKNLAKEFMKEVNG